MDIMRIKEQLGEAELHNDITREVELEILELVEKYTDAVPVETIMSLICKFDEATKDENGGVDLQDILDSVCITFMIYNNSMEELRMYVDFTVKMVHTDYLEGSLIQVTDIYIM